MSVTSCIQKIEKDGFVTIRKSYLVVCGGDDCAAALLNYYEYRHNAKLADLEERKSNDKRYVVSESDFLMQSSNAYLKSQLLDMYSRNAIISANQKLVEFGFIKIVSDVKNKYGGKPINHILLLPNNVNKAIKDYDLQRPILNVDTEQRPILNVEQRPILNVATSQIGRNKDKVLKIKVEERVNTHTHEPKNENTFVQGESNVKFAEGVVSLENKLTFDPKAKKEYTSNFEMYEAICAFWKSDTPRMEAVKMSLDQLGITDKTPNKKKQFFEMVRDIYLPSIIANKNPFVSLIEIHNFIIQKIGYDKTKIKEFKELSDSIVGMNIVEPYTEQHILNILPQNEKNLLLELKSVNPKALEERLKQWKERNTNDETIVGVFARFAEKQIKAVLV